MPRRSRAGRRRAAPSRPCPRADRSPRTCRDSHYPDTRTLPVPLLATSSGGTMTVTLTSAHTTRLSTTTVDECDGFAYWSEAVSSTFVPLECRTDVIDGFRGELVNVGVGNVQLTRVAAAPHQVQRTRRTIARNDPGLLKVALQMQGTGRISQDGRE